MHFHPPRANKYISPCSCEWRMGLVFDALMELLGRHASRQSRSSKLNHRTA